MFHRPTIPRSKSTPRLGASGKPNARIDNTFSCDHGPRAPLRHCFSYVRELSRLRNITDFEATNEKRLMRRNYNFDDASNNSQNHDKYVPKYSQGASSYSIRAPTGVDLALGLSGYDKLGKNLPPERIPTTLQSYKDSDMMRKKSDEDEEKKRRVANLEAEEAKWTEIKAEVDQRRAREQQEHNNYVYEAKKQQLAENCEEAREEVTKQLNKAMINDWDYQREFKNRQETEHKVQENIAAAENNKVNQDALDYEEQKRKELERKWIMERQNEKTTRSEEKFEQKMIQDREKRQISVAAARDVARIQDEDDNLAQKKKLTKQRARESLESQIDLSQREAKKELIKGRKVESYKNQDNEEVNAQYVEAQNVSIDQQAQKRDEYLSYQEDMNSKLNRNEQTEDVINREVMKKLSHHEHEQIMANEAARKANTVQFYEKVNEQRQKQVQAKILEAQEKHLEQEKRLESEKNFKAEQQMAKDRRIREQRAYRDFLFTQMNERKARNDHKNWQDKVYIENRMMANNDRQDSVDKYVSNLDVNHIQAQAPEVSDSAKLT